MGDNRMSHEDSKIVLTLREASDNYLTSKEGIYLSNYLDHLDTRTAVVEKEYVDKGYLIDYSRFYARAFKSYERFTTRLHFFSVDFSEDDFKKMLLSSNTDQLKEEYLGFTVIKPVVNHKNKPLVGRTILKTYPEEINHEKRYFITEKYHVSLYGVPLEINGLPYKTQDIAVGACATTAIWVSLYPLNKLFGISLYSSYEITEKSVTLPAEIRSFPSEGLTFNQMINFIKSLGLDVEIINIEKASPEQKNSIISTAVKSYLNCRLPILVGLTLKKDEIDPPEYHAVVICGYRADAYGDIKEFYVHDDQIGPYSRTIPKDSLAEWENEWITRRGYSKLTVNKLLIPVYPKIRLSFLRIYRYFSRIKEEYPYLKFDLLLEQINSYKEFIIKNSIENKEELLFSSMPRFLWIIRGTVSDETKKDVLFDVLFDGTSIFPRIIKRVYFK